MLNHDDDHWLKKSLTPEQRKMVVFNLARVAHRNGRLEVREEYLKQFQELPNLTTADKQSLAHFQQITSTIEPKYIQLAITELENHLQNQDQDGQTLYLLGDLYRRLGNFEQSQQYFNRAMLSSGIHEEQRAIIQYFLP